LSCWEKSNRPRAGEQGARALAGPAAPCDSGGPLLVFPSRETKKKKKTWVRLRQFCIRPGGRPEPAGGGLAPPFWLCAPARSPVELTVRNQPCGGKAQSFPPLPMVSFFFPPRPLPPLFRKLPLRRIGARAKPRAYSPACPSRRLDPSSTCTTPRSPYPSWFESSSFSVIFLFKDFCFSFHEGLYRKTLLRRSGSYGLRALPIAGGAKNRRGLPSS